MTCDQALGKGHVQWVVWKIARGFPKYRYEGTTKVINLHRIALIFLGSSMTAALVLGGVTLLPAISSLVNKMLSRAKARASGRQGSWFQQLCQAEFSSHHLPPRSSCLLEHGLLGPQTMLLNPPVHSTLNWIRWVIRKIRTCSHDTFIAR